MVEKADEKTGDPKSRREPKGKVLLAPILIRSQDGKHNDKFFDYVLEVDKDRVYIKSETPYEVGTLVHLMLELPGMNRGFHFKGEVVRINPHKPTTPEGLDPGMGIILERVGYDDRRLVNQYMEKFLSSEHTEDYSRFISWISKMSRPMSTKERETVKRDLLKALYGSAKGKEPIPSSRRKKSAEEAELLSRIPLFETMDELELDELLRIMVKEEFRAGDAVFDEGDVGEKMYVLVKGAVDIIKATGKGRPGQILVSLGPGDYFGEMSLIDDAPRSASVMATDETVLFSMHKKDLSLLLDNYPAIAAKIYRFFVLTLNERLRETNEKIKTFVTMAQEMSQS